MSEKIIIESLSMDLMRVALGLNRGSTKMAERFSEECLKRVNEVNKSKVKPYFIQILDKIKNSLSKPFENRTAEDALMYSVLCKNYARKFLT